MIADPWIAHLTRERRPANTIAAARRVLRSLPHADTATREDVEGVSDMDSHAVPLVGDSHRVSSRWSNRSA